MRKILRARGEGEARGGGKTRNICKTVQTFFLHKSVKNVTKLVEKGCIHLGQIIPNLKSFLH